MSSCQMEALYADQFGDERLWEFGLWLEHALGAIRVDQRRIEERTAQNFFKNDVLNLLDVIASGFRPEQVIAHLKAHHTHREIYANESIESGKKVRSVYKQAVLTYYDQTAGVSLSNKERWITAKLKGGVA
jgi:hypothetical protein